MIPISPLGVRLADGTISQDAKDEVLDFTRTSHSMQRPHDTWSLMTTASQGEARYDWFVGRTADAERRGMTIVYTPTIAEVEAYMSRKGPLMLPRTGG